VRPSKLLMYLSGLAIEGMPLTMTCLSKGGYPKQDVSWYRGSVSTGNRLNASVSYVNNTLYDVTSTLAFNPTSQDDGVPYICQSSYRDNPRLDETSRHILKLACIKIVFVSTFNSCCITYLYLRYIKQFLFDNRRCSYQSMLHCGVGYKYNHLCFSCKIYTKNNI